MASTYEDLDVYKLAYELIVQIHVLSKDFPKNELYGGVTDQMRRSSRSVCANLAEGLNKRMSESDEKRFISIALGSAEETRFWLQLCGTLEYLQPEVVNQLREEYRRVCMMLFKLGETRAKKAA